LLGRTTGGASEGLAEGFETGLSVGLAVTGWAVGDGITGSRVGLAEYSPGSSHTNAYAVVLHLDEFHPIFWL